jgi:shikimate dehydrogenase
MATNYQAQLVALLGKPVAENPTGVMQEAAFREVGLNWRYLNLEVAPERLADAIVGVRAMGIAGLNLTIPHKVAVMSLLDEISPAARLIGAVNTVRRDGERLLGENTDGKGFLRALQSDAGHDVRGQRILLLGAGGAARAMATELALAGAREIVVVNRSAERGQAMVADLARGTGVATRWEPWTRTYAVPAGFHVLANATSAGLYPNVDEMPDVDLSGADETMLVCDAVFNPAETRLLRTAAARGLRTLDGLSMLVYQGIIGFELWTGHAAPEAVMKRALQQALAEG